MEQNQEPFEEMHDDSGLDTDEDNFEEEPDLITQLAEWIVDGGFLDGMNMHLHDVQSINEEMMVAIFDEAQSINEEIAMMVAIFDEAQGGEHRLDISEEEFELLAVADDIFK